MPFTYTYPRPALTVDCVVFGLDEKDLKVLLIQRDRDPFAGMWALPGGFVMVNESPDDAAGRELFEETGLTNIFLEQLHTFGDPGRDPREHVVTVVYYGLVNLWDHVVHPATDARDAAWFRVDDIPALSFDHNRIFDMALQRLRGKIQYIPIGFELLPARFTMDLLRQLYEKILGRSLDRGDFRKKIMKMGILENLNAAETDASHRAARLYCFDKEKYDRITRKGFDFEI